MSGYDNEKASFSKEPSVGILFRGITREDDTDIQRDFNPLSDPAGLDIADSG
jgi:hypothetical protein